MVVNPLDLKATSSSIPSALALPHRLIGKWMKRWRILYDFSCTSTKYEWNLFTADLCSSK
jgi:hypothetical protein